MALRAYTAYRIVNRHTNTVPRTSKPAVHVLLTPQLATTGLSFVEQSGWKACLGHPAAATCCTAHTAVACGEAAVPAEASAM